MNARQVLRGQIASMAATTRQLEKMAEEAEQKRQQIRIDRVVAKKKAEEEARKLEAHHIRIDRQKAKEHAAYEKQRVRIPKNLRATEGVVHPDVLSGINVTQGCRDRFRGGIGWLYFLLDQGKVVYIGKTNTSVDSRVMAAISDGKVFDDFWVLRIDLNAPENQRSHITNDHHHKSSRQDRLLSWMEHDHITELRPKYNKRTW